MLRLDVAWPCPRFVTTSFGARIVQYADAKKVSGTVAEGFLEEIRRTAIRRSGTCSHSGTLSRCFGEAKTCRQKVILIFSLRLFGAALFRRAIQLLVAGVSENRIRHPPHTTISCSLERRCCASRLTNQRQVQIMKKLARSI